VVLNVLKIVAILLIVAGIAGLLYGKFTYTQATHEAKLGPLDLSVKEKKTVNIPLWAGVAAIVAGGLLLVVPRTGGPK
jgi:TRAP-type C4-dicarboxylate transport system permease small subunit